MNNFETKEWKKAVIDLGNDAAKAAVSIEMLTKDTKKIKKPPLGIRPKWLVEEEYKSNRITEINDAIKRYLNESAKIPLKWIEEYNELINK